VDPSIVAASRAAASAVKASGLAVTADALPVIQTAPLPFQPGTAPPVFPSTPKRPRAPTNTVELRDPDFDPPTIAEDDAPDASAALPTFTVEHYASLCAEIAANPEDVEAIRRKYHLASKDQHVALDCAFNIRFARDDALHAHWRSLVASYTSWIAGKTPST
jgi:hypothetical protein